MGMLIEVYRSADGVDCTANGISKNYDKLVCVNVEGPFEPNERAPAVKLVTCNIGKTKSLRLVPIDSEGNEIGSPMYGGNHAGTSDSRFSRAIVEKLGVDVSIDLVKVFDRFETPRR